MENYLVTIHYLNKKKGFVKTTELAGLMGYAPASITEMFRKMNDLGFVIYESYKGVKLTKKGKEFAENVFIRREIIKKFLLLTSMPSELAKIESERIESTLSGEAFAYILMFLNKDVGLNYVVFIYNNHALKRIFIYAVHITNTEYNLDIQK